jgi:DNA polymerase-3 subunit gamma/tau
VAYTVLARKYRSRTFDEVIGQQPIATTLVNAIKTGRIHHGYLFTGTRGVGKTSMARILAKALNCLNAEEPTPTPCGECDACRAIGEGQDIDVIEIDAASNTGVDNIRELRSNTAYRPARSRFKVYIIDEVHMLSTGAFNALLKTLEEPPEHVKFVLATTEIQKVPATIQSRCQRFAFRNIGPEDIQKRLAEIAKAEGAKAEDVALRRIARLANGSMRDALSILDQLLSVSPTNVTAQLLDEILPPAQDEQIFGLIKNAAAGDAAAVLADVDKILAGGRGLDVFCNDTIEAVRALMLIRACGPDAPMVDLPAGARDEYVRLSAEFELSQYVQMIAMLEELRRNVRFSGAGRALTDACMVRLARMRAWAPIEQLLAQLPEGGDGSEKKKVPVGVRPLGTDHACAPEPAVKPQPRSMDRRAATAGGPSGRAYGEPMPTRAGLPHQPAQTQPARAGRFVPEAFEPAPDVDERPFQVEIPDDYHPDDAAADEALMPGESARLRPLGGGISTADRARIMQDPLVRRVMDLFDGNLEYVDRRTQRPASQTGQQLTE